MERDRQYGHMSDRHQIKTLQDMKYTTAHYPLLNHFGYQSTEPILLYKIDLVDYLKLRLKILVLVKIRYFYFSRPGGN